MSHQGKKSVPRSTVRGSLRGAGGTVGVATQARPDLGPVRWGRGFAGPSQPGVMERGARGEPLCLCPLMGFGSTAVPLVSAAGAAGPPGQGVRRGSPPAGSAASFVGRGPSSAAPALCLRWPGRSRGPADKARPAAGTKAGGTLTAAAGLPRRLPNFPLGAGAESVFRNRFFRGMGLEERGSICLPCSLPGMWPPRSAVGTDGSARGRRGAGRGGRSGSADPGAAGREQRAWEGIPRSRCQGFSAAVGKNL